MAKAKPKKAKVDHSGGFFESKFFVSFMGKLYGLGASVVILGALFKIQHWPMAGMMLTLGLTTEAIIFAVSAFEPQHKKLDWTKVYPELGEDADAVQKGGVVGEIDKMLEEAEIDSKMISRLGQGMNSLAETASQMKDLSQTTVATQEFTEKIQAVTQNVGKINDTYEKTAEALSNLSTVSEQSKDYFDQMKAASRHLASLNALYEMELNDTDKHREALNKYQANLNRTIGNLVEAEEVTSGLKEGFVQLSKNLSSLNNVYGNMLSAMAR